MKHVPSAPGTFRNDHSVPRQHPARIEDVILRCARRRCQRMILRNQGWVRRSTVCCRVFRDMPGGDNGSGRRGGDATPVFAMEFAVLSSGTPHLAVYRTSGDLTVNTSGILRRHTVRGRGNRHRVHRLAGHHNPWRWVLPLTDHVWEYHMRRGELRPRSGHDREINTG